MTMAAWITFYLTLNGLIATAALLGWLSRRLLGDRQWVTFGQELRWHYCLLILLLLAPVVAFLCRDSIEFVPFVRVWNGPVAKSWAGGGSAIDVVGPVVSIADTLISPIRLSLVEQLGRIWAALVSCGAGMALLIAARDLRRARTQVRQSFPLRVIGRVRIFISDQVATPFSVRLGQWAEIILPASLLADKDHVRVAVLHELQHHRQRDTSWVYGFWLLRVLCGWNPFVYMWSTQVMELQEFACDEALVGHKRVSPQVYARCLLEIAESVVGRDRGLVCATGLSFLAKRHLITRRVERMFTKRNRIHVNRQRRMSVGLITGSILLFCGMAVAANDLIQDRRVTMEQANGLGSAAAKAAGGVVPIVVNEKVLDELNRFLGTADGRDFMRKSLVRMQTHRTMILEKLKAANLPEELLAIPIIESGYRSLPERKGRVRSAGMWQFIPDSARMFGLRVDAEVDERLNVEMETDAALRLVASTYRTYGTWDLAILAYNSGEKALDRAIVNTNSRDVWVVSRAAGDRNYYAKFMAALLIMGSPQSLD